MILSFYTSLNCFAIMQSTKSPLLFIIELGASIDVSYLAMTVFDNMDYKDFEELVIRSYFEL